MILPMARPTPLSGFPEWLPGDRAVERAVIDSLRRTFELHGFSEIETRAVEPVTQLTQQGETSKEVYVISRLHDESGGGEARLGLHFDLTVPLARYVLEHAGQLVFPFKRYQIQKVWRGERPQDGRFREFYQADIDVIGAQELPFLYEVELPLVMAEALAALPLPPIRMVVNNRKVAEGFYRGIGIEDVPATLRAVDKLAKIGSEAVIAELVEAKIASAAQAEQVLALAKINGSDESVAQRVHDLGVSSELLSEGLSELTALITAAHERLPGVIAADLSIARGLDYYTGSVFETTLEGHEDLGSICSGGRYDSLARAGNRIYPGVGLSIGVSRLVARMLSADMVRINRAVPTVVLVALAAEEERGAAQGIAHTLRQRGIAADVAPTAAKFGRQIRHADRLGIPYVWFPGRDGEPDEVKDIRSGDQVAATATTWQPPSQDLRQHLVPGEVPGTD